MDKDIELLVDEISSQLYNDWNKDAKYTWRDLPSYRKDSYREWVREHVMTKVLEAGELLGVKAVIDYLKNEVATQDKRSGGEPKITAHFNAMEKGILGTVINALEEWRKEVHNGRTEGTNQPPQP